MWHGIGIGGPGQRLYLKLTAKKIYRFRTVDNAIANPKILHEPVAENFRYLLKFVVGRRERPIKISQYTYAYNVELKNMQYY